MRWHHSEPLDRLNDWLGSEEFKSTTGLTGVVNEDGTQRTWEYRDRRGVVKLRVTGGHALGPYTGRRIRH